MHRRSVRALGVAAVLATTSWGQSTERVNVSTAGVQADMGGGWPAISADGRFVAFTSYASNLVPPTNFDFQDVYVRDRQALSTEMVSVETGATSSFASESSDPSISADGRCVAFWSNAPDLVLGDTNGFPDVFVRDRQTGTTERVSVDSAGAQANELSQRCAISADGRFVTFDSRASNLVAGDTNIAWDVFLRDRQNGTTERVSVGTGGIQANSGSHAPSISADGRVVAFFSNASNLAASDANSVLDVFVRDVQAGTTECISVASPGVTANGSSLNPAISADGRFVAFQSTAPNLVAGDTNAVPDVFVRDRATATTARVSVGGAGLQANSGSTDASISKNGRFVAFQSEASNLVAGDTNGSRDVFVRDLLAGTTELISLGVGAAQADSSSWDPSISADGRAVVFISSATNLVAGDTNGWEDIFVRDLGPAPPTAFCTAGTTTNACVPNISGLGTPSASAGSGFTIAVASVEGQKSDILFYGLSGAIAQPWGASTSFLCVKAPVQRMGTLSSGGTLGACDGSLAIDWNSYIASNPGAHGNPFAGGETVWAQAWFRDPPSPKTTALSNAIEFVVGP
jgi:Tol biopolymer transport system component